MFKTPKVDKLGGQTGNEDHSEEVVITEEKIVGDDGVERIITKMTKGTKVTTTIRNVFNSDGKELPKEFKNWNIKSETKKPINSKSTFGSSFSSSSSSSSKDEGFTPKVNLASSKSSSSTSSNSANEPSSKPTDDDKEFAEECLKWHNYYREKHGVKPLKLSSKVSLF
jgi:hypothetical protein